MDERNDNACYAILQHRDNPLVDMFEITKQQFIFSNIPCETEDLSQLKVLVNTNHTFALFSNKGENFAVHLLQIQENDLGYDRSNPYKRKA